MDQTPAYISATRYFAHKQISFDQIIASERESCSSTYTLIKIIFIAIYIYVYEVASSELASSTLERAVDNQFANENTIIIPQD